jgi:hypothetical protein
MPRPHRYGINLLPVSSHLSTIETDTPTPQSFDIDHLLVIFTASPPHDLSTSVPLVLESLPSDTYASASNTQSMNSTLPCAWVLYRHRARPRTLVVCDKLCQLSTKDGVMDLDTRRPTSC